VGRCDTAPEDRAFMVGITPRASGRVYGSL
jgi:hypothetical protein